MKLLDTDTCIGILKGVPAVVAAWRNCNEQCALPTMTIGELYYGAYKSEKRDEELERVRRFVAAFPEIKQSHESISWLVVRGSWLVARDWGFANHEPRIANHVPQGRSDIPVASRGSWSVIRGW